MTRHSLFISIIISSLTIFLCGLLFAKTTTVILKGKLLDVNGQPNKYALVGYAEDNSSKVTEFAEIDNKGNYTAKITKPGMQYLMFSIPSHSSLRIPIYNDKSKKIKLNVTLATYKYKDSLNVVYINGTIGAKGKQEMIKGEDGIFTYEAISDSATLKYQLLDIEKYSRTINAPESFDYKTDGSGDYWSIAKVENGKALITFDPKKLLTSDKEYKIEIEGDRFDKQVVNCIDEYSKISNAYYDVILEMRKKGSNNRDEIFIDKGDYFEKLITKIEAEKNPKIKDLLKILYVAAANNNPKRYSMEKASEYFESLAPNNIVWEILPEAFWSIYGLVPPFKHKTVMNNFLEQSNSKTIINNILSNNLYHAKQAEDTVELKRLHELISTKYKDEKDLQELLKKIPITIKIKVGAEIPDFEVISLDNPNEKFSKKSMLGKIYLIDFWATWCGPCVGEMQNLHAVFEKYKDKGFEILSLSWDKNANDVEKFRKDKWKMPWKNSFIGSGKLADEFEVLGIPKPILVGADGKILEKEKGLRGAELEKTLAKYFK